MKLLLTALIALNLSGCAALHAVAVVNDAVSLTVAIAQKANKPPVEKDAP